MYLSIQETSEVLGVKPETVRTWCKTGSLPYRITPAGKWLLPEVYLKNLRWWCYGCVTQTMARIYRDRDEVSGPPDQQFELLTIEQTAELLSITVVALKRRAKCGAQWSTVIYRQRFFDPLKLAPITPDVGLPPRFTELEIQRMRRQDRLMTTQQVCALLGIAAKTLRSWRKQGRLWYIKRDKGYLFYRDDIERMKARLQELTLTEVIERLNLATSYSVYALVKKGLLRPIRLPNDTQRSKRYRTREVKKLAKQREGNRCHNGVTLTKAAHLLGVSKTTLLDWAARGYIKQHTDGDGTSHYNHDDIQRILTARRVFMGGRSQLAGQPVTAPRQPVKTLSEAATARRLGIAQSSLGTWSRQAQVIFPYCNLSPSAQMIQRRFYPAIYVDAFLAYAAAQQRRINTELAGEFFETDEAQAILHWL